MENRRSAFRGAAACGGRPCMVAAFRQAARAAARLGADIGARHPDVLWNVVGGRAGGRAVLSRASPAVDEFLVLKRMGRAGGRVALVWFGSFMVRRFSELAVRG